MQATLVVTDALPAPARMVGEGTFSGNQKFEGMLSWRTLEGGARATAVPAPPRRAGAGPERERALRLLWEKLTVRTGTP